MAQDQKTEVDHSLLALLKKDQGIQKLKENLEQGFAGAARGLTADLLGAPVDLIAAALRPFGYANEKPALGSAFIREKTGMPQQESGASLVGNLLSSFVAPEKLPMAAAGIMMGRKSATWNARAEKAAEALLEGGATPEQVWRSQGVYKAPVDRQPRQEIADADSFFKTSAGKKFLIPPDEFISQNLLGKSIRVDKIFEHPELYKAYPELRTLRVKFDPGQEGASFSSQAGLIRIGTAHPGIKHIEEKLGTKAAEEYRTHQMKLSILHELQHAVQKKEGFERGGNPDSIYRALIEERSYADPTKRIDEDEDLMLAQKSVTEYSKLAGEAEARMVENRAELDAESRKFFPAEDSPFGYDMNPDTLKSKPDWW